MRNIPFRGFRNHKEDRQFESPPLYQRGTANRQRSHLTRQVCRCKKSVPMRRETRLLVGWDRQFESPPLHQRGTANRGALFFTRMSVHRPRDNGILLFLTGYPQAFPARSAARKKPPPSWPKGR